MKRVALLGATGSIGASTLEVLRECRATHRLVAAAACTRVEELARIAREFLPTHLAVGSAPARADLARQVDPTLAIHTGPDGLIAMLRESRPDLVLSGISGAAGLPAALEAVRLGTTLAIANKEPLVMAGPLVLREAQRSGAKVIPVDSEHSAIFQALHGERRQSVRRFLLTASGGPFRGWRAPDLATVTPQQALRHPTWNMGPKITVDSATLMNKALEIVEARWLFDEPPEKIEVLIHPQSIVHSMVEFTDGSILAQMGVPTMKVPIRFALSYPERGHTTESYFDLQRFACLTFEAPDTQVFPALNLGFEAARRGGTAGAVLNAANEVAVEAFLAGEIAFNRIAATVEAVLDKMPQRTNPDLETVLEADRKAREEALQCLTVRTA
ncbi:MAG: 1-deoxy-D-xylulose-5-phosphate reductoisomerase [Planctomycetota bacterium]